MMNEKTKPLDQLESEDDIIGAFGVMLNEAQDAAASRIKAARKAYRFFLGDHYIRESPDGMDWENDDEVIGFARPRFQRDIISQVVNSLRPILLKGRPQVIVTADYPDQPAELTMGNGMGSMQIPGGLTDADLAQNWQDLFDAQLDHRSEGILQAQLLCDVQVTGTAFRKLKCNESGEITPMLLDISQVLPDPYGTLMDFTDCKYVILCHEMDAADIERIYRVGEKDFADSKGGVPEDDSRGLFRRIWERFTDSFGNPADRLKWARRRYPVYEIYYNQGTPLMVAEGERPPKSLKYPNGRRLVIVNSKKVVVDEPNPYWHKQFPVVVYQANPIPHRFHGVSDIERLLDPQMTTNILQNIIILNAILSGNSQWMYEEGSLLADYVSDEPGLMIPVAPGALSQGRVQRLAPQEVSRSAREIMADIERHAKEDLGQADDVLRGREPTGNASGVAINALQQGVVTQQAFKIEMLDVSHRRGARLEISMMQQYLDFEDPRISRLLNMGEYLSWSEAMRDLLYDIDVESKADLPHNVLARLNQGANFLQMGIYDLKEFLRFTNLNVRPELRQKLEEASKNFIPGIPLEMQAQLIIQSAIAQAQQPPPQQGMPPQVGRGGMPPGRSMSAPPQGMPQMEGQGQGIGDLSQGVL